MSDEKSYGDIGFHEYYFGSDLKKTVSAQKWNEVAAKIIAEYERRNLKPAPQLPSVETIAETIYDCLELVTTRGNVLTAAQAVLALLQAKQTIGVDMAAPGADKTVIVRYPACKGKNCGCTDGMSHSKECIAEYAAATKMQDESEEKQAETEEQYQSRLLRALRDFG